MAERIENMENDNTKLKIIYSVAFGAIAAVIFIIAITIVADLYLPLKDWLKGVFSHHWVGKGILSVAVFIFIGLISRFLPITASENKLNKVLKLLSLVMILGVILIFLFFIYEAVWK